MVMCIVTSYFAQSYFLSNESFQQKAIENWLLHAMVDNHEVNDNKIIGDCYRDAGAADNTCAERFKLIAIYCGIASLFLQD